MRWSTLILFVTICFLTVPVAVFSTVAPNRMFASNMVIQHGIKVPVWGTAASGEAITVSVNSQIKSATASNAGAWTVTLDSLSIGGPFTIQIQGSNLVTLSNVMVGDVWVCSGQSNMSNNFNDFGINTQVASGYSSIRIMNFIAGTAWSESSPSTVGPFSPTAFFYGKSLYDSLHIPIGLIESAWGCTRVESWMTPQNIADNPDLDTATYVETCSLGFRVAELYKKYIAPIIPFPIRGVIWYQGESNTSAVNAPGRYFDRFTGMIQGWRNQWGIGDFPFYLVQLANFNAGSGDDWPTVRDAQRRTLDKVPNTGMAVTIDIGMSNNIHPVDKQDVGYRLALNALCLNYGHSSLVRSGPLFKGITVSNDTACISFNFANSGLVAKNGTLLAFEVSATVTNANFVSATAWISGKNVLVCKKGTVPRMVRYAWANDPPATLFNVEGLPASPFLSPDVLVAIANKDGGKVRTESSALRQEAALAVYDLAGRCVAVLPKGTISADRVGKMLHLPKGIYFVRTQSLPALEVRKIVQF